MYMYSDKTKERSPLPGLLVILAVVLAVVWLAFGRRSGKDISEEAAAAVRDAVLRSARQCYVVEGIYPADLAYLEDNYGLQVNTRDFYVSYSAFASNLPPDVKVTPKAGQK